MRDRAAAAASSKAATPAAAAAADAAPAAAAAAALAAAAPAAGAVVGEGRHQGGDGTLLPGSGTRHRDVPGTLGYAAPGRRPATGPGRLYICGCGGRPVQ